MELPLCSLHVLCSNAQELFRSRFIDTPELLADHRRKSVAIAPQLKRRKQMNVQRPAWPTLFRASAFGIALAALLPTSSFAADPIRIGHVAALSGGPPPKGEGATTRGGLRC